MYFQKKHKQKYLFFNPTINVYLLEMIVSVSIIVTFHSVYIGYVQTVSQNPILVHPNRNWMALFARLIEANMWETQMA